MGDDHFEAEGGEDSLLTNAELAAGAISSILWDSDLKKVETLHVEEALTLSLQGDRLYMYEHLLLFVFSLC